MSYTIAALATLAGVTTRTLRYYDQIGLLPAQRLPNGERTYEKAAVDTLQQILFYRTLGFSLEQIRALMQAPNFDRLAALRRHHAQLLTKQQMLTRLIHTVEKTIAQAEGRSTMTDAEKFEGFKQQHIAKNEQAYGVEIRQRYGDSAVDAANRAYLQHTQTDLTDMQALDSRIRTALEQAVQQQADPRGPAGETIVRLHRRWLAFTWPPGYTAQAYRGLADLYVQDTRFTSYYDAHITGCAAFLRQAIYAATQA